jgi:hypothetical protein
MQKQGAAPPRTNSPFRRACAAAFFVAQIAAIVVLNRASAAREHSSAVPAVSAATTATSLARYGFHLEEVAKRSGIDFTHETPHLDQKLAHIMPNVASMGAAVSISDFDRDGWPDIYLTNSGENTKNRLYRNNHDGTFTDVAEKVGLADLNRDGTGVSTGAIWGDYDNDGYEDLTVYKWGRPLLFHNDTGKRFTDTTANSGLPAWVNANSAIWLDFDNDGKLDLLLCGYYPENVDLWRLKNTRMMPDSFEYAENGGRKYLLKGRGDGTFEDVTARVGLNSHRWTLAAASAHLSGGPYPDIFLANDYGVSELWRNEGGKRFTEIGKDSGVGAAPKSGMNVAFGDILNSGKQAVYVTNISEEGVLIQGNNLWVPRDDSPPGKPVFNNLAHDMGVEMGGWSFGAQFGDLNNDGYLDLYLTNGFVSADRNRSYWYDFAKVAGGNAAIISDAANWPPFDGRSLSGYQQKRVWLNDGAGHFTEVAQAVGATDTRDGRSVALADLGNRGVLDVLVANQRGPFLLYRNTAAPENDWVMFDLEGTRSNRSAIGAVVTLFWNGQKQVQEVMGGSGFCAQNDRRLHFGLGRTGAQIEKAVIRWPSGRETVLTSPKVRTVVKVREPAA